MTIVLQHDWVEGRGTELFRGLILIGLHILFANFLELFSSLLSARSRRVRLDFAVSPWRGKYPRECQFQKLFKRIQNNETGEKSS